MICAGIDYSMSCPAICISTKGKLNFDSCQFFFYNSSKKFDTSFGRNIHGFMQRPWSNTQERFDNISEWAITILKKYNVTSVCLEDYAMGAKGQVFNIGENTGLLKHKLWKNNIDFFTPKPTQIKKFFTGKGNAKKEDMYSRFVELTNQDLEMLLDSKASSNPISDLVDSYAMVKYNLESGHLN